MRTLLFVCEALRAGRRGVCEEDGRCEEYVKSRGWDGVKRRGWNGTRTRYESPSASADEAIRISSESRPNLVRISSESRSNLIRISRSAHATRMGPSSQTGPPA
jgi:hypothetical protein